MGTLDLEKLGGIFIAGSIPFTKAAANTTYSPITGVSADNVEADNSISAPRSGRLKKLVGKTTANSINGTLTTQLRINGASQGTGVVITASTNEEVEQTEVINFAKGDDINFIHVSLGSTGTARYHFIAEIEWD